MPLEGIWGLYRVIEGCIRFYRLRCFRAETCGVEGAGPQGGFGLRVFHRNCLRIWSMRVFGLVVSLNGFSASDDPYIPI